MHKQPRHPRFSGCQLTDTRRDSSGAERKDEDDTATAILKKKKKPNQLMYVQILRLDRIEIHSDKPQGH